MSKRLLKKLALVGSTLPVALMAQSAHAAIDITAATSGIAEAGVAILAVIGALLAMSVSIFGLAKVYGFIKRRAGA